MIPFIIIFLSINILVFGLDRYFYMTMVKVLEFKGLNLAKSIIEAHHGEIKAYNDNGLNFEIKFYNVNQ